MTGGNDALERVVARVRLRAARRAAWLRKLWAEEEKPGGEVAVTHREMDTHLGDRDAPEAEAAWLASEPAVAGLNRRIADVEDAIARDADSRLASLVRTFGLGDESADVLHACLAVALDPALGRVYAYLNDHVARGYVTEELAARLFGRGRGGVWPATSPLRRWELVRERETPPGQPPALVCDRYVRDWLASAGGLDPRLAGRARSVAPREPLESWPVGPLSEKVERVVDPGAAEPDSGRPGARVHVVGPPGSGRRTFAAAVCRRLGLEALAVDTGDLGGPEWPPVFRAAQRQAWLDGRAPAWHGGTALEARWPRDVAAFPVHFVIREDDDPAPARRPDLVDLRVELPPATLQERRALWRRAVPESRTWPDEPFEILLHRRARAGEIVSAARRGVAGPDEAEAALREGRRRRLGELAHRLECPFGWDDLVVPDRIRRALEALAFEARDRTRLWARPGVRRLFPRGRGLLALLSGPPGTGKTMAAQVIAADLGVAGADLYRIDLSTVVSKYVGETSKHLSRILSRARHMDAVLLFDEADALFAKRTDEIGDAHDRFANTETGFLLQAIEEYTGVALLATNKKGNIDEAFLRRLRYVIELPKPDAGLRLAIWRRLLDELATPETLPGGAENGRLDGSVEGLARSTELTGAQIKGAVLTALFATRRDGAPLGPRHLLTGVERELAKDGRALGARERAALSNGGSGGSVPAGGGR